MSGTPSIIPIPADHVGSWSHWHRASPVSWRLDSLSLCAQTRIFHSSHYTSSAASWKARPPTCEGGRIMTKYILRTDKSGERWEIGLRDDGTTMHRLEGDAPWLDGWPPSMPSSKDSDTP